MKKILLLGLFMTSVMFAKADVIISQYYEGSGNNKWVEITNVGSTSVTLSGFICLFSNARADNPSAFSPSAQSTLSGTLTAGESKMFRHGSANAPAYALTGSTTTGACGFSGNDLVILSTSNGSSAWADRTDVVGNGVENWGQNTSFHRNAGILSGNTTYTTSEWTEVTIATVDGASASATERLGEHEFDNPTAPISIASFDAKPMNSKSVSLDWVTSSEENNEYFSIEHSTDGREFTQVDIVEGALNSTEMQYYNYEHKDAAKGDNYYRLRQVDTDGNFSFSEVEVVKLGSSIALEARPTLAKGNVTIAINEGFDTEATIEVYNILGRLVVSEVLSRGETQAEINVNNLQKGHYMVKLTNGMKSKTTRFIKQ